MVQKRIRKIMVTNVTYCMDVVYSYFCKHLALMISFCPNKAIDYDQSDVKDETEMK